MMKLSAPKSCALQAVVALLCLAGAVPAQQTISSVRIYADPPEASFFVDGVLYTGSATFLWPRGTVHRLGVTPLQLSTRNKVRYAFAYWTDSSGLLDSASQAQTVIADPSITYIKATFKVEYALMLIFSKCPSITTGNCYSPGTVYVNGVGYSGDKDIFFEPGAVVRIAAQPNPGFIFTGWLQGLGNASQAFMNTVVMDQPRAVYPRFERTGYLKLETSPPGFELLADRTPVKAPYTVEWGMGTTHSVGVVSPQLDREGRMWVFHSWSDGGALSHAYTMPTVPDANRKLTANFVPGARVTLITSPPGLSLKVDGREKWQSYNFDWAPGTTHSIEAPERQTDSEGRAWVFQSWSNGGPAVQQIVTPDDTNIGLRLTAVYHPLGRISVESSPAGVPIRVDGQDCAAPCVLERPAGALLRLSAPASATPREGVRLDFAGWSDGGGADREYTVPAANLTLTASYRERYLVTFDTEPAGAARLVLDPASADGYYDAGQSVLVSLEPKTGFRFLRWDGDLSGTSRAVTVVITAPQRISAVFEAVPEVPPNGVQNAAAPTPDGSVAPGSMVSILGANLAPDTVIGPESPLAQTLAGVVVRIGDRILPLLYVSPEQINAVLPPDLPEGEQKLIIRLENQPEARVAFTVASHAPGLFAFQVDEQAFAAAAHQDGTPVSLENPARLGEVVTLFGTGFGPYSRKPPEGFAVPPAPAYPLRDPVEIVAGEVVFVPEFAGAAPGHVGMDALRIRVPDTFATGSVEIRARINSRESNTVLLPVGDPPDPPEAAPEP